jgi:cobalamin biosynthesis Mg chelatase CobN
VSGARLPSGQIPAATAAQPAGQAAESSGTPFLALIIILSVLLVVAVGAAVYFALRRA